MESVLPLFPLNVVVYPDEPLNLHIFEPRYKALVKDCLEQEKPFGIPAYLQSKLEYGTTIYIQEVTKTYSDGRLDIKTRGAEVFRINEYCEGETTENYATGQVNFPENDMDSPHETWVKFVEKVNELFDVLMIQNKVSLEDDVVSYHVAHKIGLNLQQEYELLTLLEEQKRQEYIIQHLNTTIPVIREVERAKIRIQMNGHFKHFDPLKF